MKDTTHYCVLCGRMGPGSEHLCDGSQEKFCEHDGPASDTQGAAMTGYRCDPLEPSLTVQAAVCILQEEYWCIHIGCGGEVKNVTDPITPHRYMFVCKGCGTQNLGPDSLLWREQASRVLVAYATSTVLRSGVTINHKNKEKIHD